MLTNTAKLLLTSTKAAGVIAALVLVALAVKPPAERERVAVVYKKVADPIRTGSIQR